MLHSSVFHVASVSCFRGMFRESRGSARALREGSWRAWGLQMGRTMRLGSYEQGVLILIQAPGPTHTERGGGLGEGVAGAARVRVRGGAR